MPDAYSCGMNHQPKPDHGKRQYDEAPPVVGFHPLQGWGISHQA